MLVLAQEAKFTSETLLWIIGVAAVPTLGWAFLLHLMVWHCLQICRELLVMHKDADRYGFGTVTMTKLIEHQDRSLRALVHYVKWFVQKQTGEEPPPPSPVDD